MQRGVAQAEFTKPGQSQSRKRLQLQQAQGERGPVRGGIDGRREWVQDRYVHGDRPGVASVGGVGGREGQPRWGTGGGNPMHDGHDRGRFQERGMLLRDYGGREYGAGREYGPGRGYSSDMHGAGAAFASPGGRGGGGGRGGWMVTPGSGGRGMEGGREESYAERLSRIQGRHYVMRSAGAAPGVPDGAVGPSPYAAMAPPPQHAGMSPVQHGAFPPPAHHHGIPRHCTAAHLCCPSNSTIHGCMLLL